MSLPPRAAPSDANPATGGAHREPPPRTSVSVLLSAVSYAQDRLADDLRSFAVFDRRTGEVVAGNHVWSERNAALFEVAQRVEARLPTSDGLGPIRDWWMLTLPADDIVVAFLTMGADHRGITIVDNRYAGPAKLFGNVLPAVLMQCAAGTAMPQDPAATDATSPSSTDFGEALMTDLRKTLPGIGLSPLNTVITQHRADADGVEPVLVLTTEENGSSTQRHDAAVVGVATILNEVLTRVAPPPPTRPAPVTSLPADQPATPPQQPPAPTDEPAAAHQAMLGFDEAQIWSAFEDAMRPALGRGAGRAVKASRKAATRMSNAELHEFLSQRLENFGAQAVEAFRAALEG